MKFLKFSPILSSGEENIPADKSFCIYPRMFLLEFFAVIFIVVGTSCSHKAKANSVIYVDCQIKNAHSSTYNPAARTCGSGTETAYKTLEAAAERILPGQTVIIREGTYSHTLRPGQSGQIDNYICFKNFPGEEPVISGTSLEPAIDISDRSYIIIEGLKINGVRRWLYAIRANHNIIRNNHFLKAVDPHGSSKTGLFFQQAMYNTIIDNTIEECNQDSLSLIKSDRNLIVNNTFRKAKHTLWTIKGGNFNVIRNNYFHNELQKIGEVYDCHKAGFDHEFFEYDCTKHNLVEQNTFAYVPSSGNSSPYSGIQYAGQKGIIRNNLFYDTVGPSLDMTLYGKEAAYNTGNRIYNNVFYGSDFAGISLSASKNFTFADNILKNNILTESNFVANDTRWPWWTNMLDGKPVQILAGRLDGFVCRNNNFFSKCKDSQYLVTLGSRKALVRSQGPLSYLEVNYPELFKDNMERDPLFVNEEKRDFHLKIDSPMIDAGAFLTQTVSDGEGIFLPVEDAGYFYDGYNIPGQVGDLIRIEGRDYVARIVKIDYEKNVLELSQSLVWAKGHGVSLYYLGNRPDLGPFEFVPGGNHPPIAEFTSYPRNDALLTIDVEASASCDKDGNITKYSWDFGDGTREPNGPTAMSHTYTEPGAYNVTLKVFDNNQPQLTGNAMLTVSVGKPVLSIIEEKIDFGPMDRTKSIELRNNGEGTLSYRISASDPWLTVDKSSGRFTTQTQTILVNINRADIKVGRYNGRITVDAGTAGVHNIEVSMTIPKIKEVELISVGDKWKYGRGIVEPPATWNCVDFNDSSWLEGPSGIGYSTEVSYPTQLNDMKGNYRTVYMRRSFEVNNIDSIASLELVMQYDDGFIAYLNGREIARSPSMGPAGTPAGFRKDALFPHDEEEPEEIFYIEVRKGLLSENNNVLAIEFHNEYIKSSDSCAVPRLTAKEICN
jgi:parallel beta-helix repeat protein